MVKIHFDGGKRKSGGITFGFVVYNSDGDELHRWGNCNKNTRLTTNDAEYYGLIEALKWAVKNNHKKVEIWGDSALVVSQVKGTFQVKAKNLKEHYGKVMSTIGYFEQFSINWTPRENNKVADSVCRDYRDGEPNDDV